MLSSGIGISTGSGGDGALAALFWAALSSVWALYLVSREAVFAAALDATSSPAPSVWGAVTQLDKIAPAVSKIVKVENFIGG